MGDLNSAVSENSMNSFCNVNSFKPLTKEPTCFKNPSNPSCIDLFIKNRPHWIQNTCTLKGISDFHKTVVTVIKVFYKTQKPELFNIEVTENLIENLSELNKELMKIDTNKAELKELTDQFWKLLDNQALKKQKQVRANNSNLMTRDNFGKK